MAKTSSIGRKGESIFRDRCIDREVTCNKSFDDDYGWDFFIEYPLDDEPAKPIDMRPAHRTALVQVKTTENYGAMSCRLKLSNALRMANSPQPFYLVLIHTAPGRDPRILVRHVWTGLMPQIFRAARVADSQCEHEISRKSISVSFDDKDDHTHDLLGFMKAEIDGAGADYGKAKRRIVETVGFENGRGIAKVTFEMETEDDMFDLLLGRREHLNLVRYEFVSERFGIPAGQAEITEGPAKLYVEPHVKAATLRMRSGKGAERIIPVEVAHAHLPDEDGGKYRIRVSAYCLEIVHGGGKYCASATISPDVASLAEIEMFGTLQHWSSDGPVDLLLTMNGVRIDLGQLDIPTPGADKQQWIRLGQAARLLRQLCASAMIEDLPVTAYQMLQASRDLEFLAALASERVAKIEFQPAPDCPALLSQTLGYIVLTVGDWTISVLAHRPIPYQKEIDGKRELFLGAARILEAHVERSAVAEMPATIDGLYREALKRLDMNNDVFEFGDLRAFVSADFGRASQPALSSG